MAFEQVFKNIDNALRTDEGCSSELDYVEQSSWILFLKYLDDLDKENEMAALLGGGTYSPILDEEYRWRTGLCREPLPGNTTSITPWSEMTS